MQSRERSTWKTSCKNLESNERSEWDFNCFCFFYLISNYEKRKKENYITSPQHPTIPSLSFTFLVFNHSPRWFAHPYNYKKKKQNKEGGNVQAPPFWKEGHKNEKKELRRMSILRQNQQTQPAPRLDICMGRVLLGLFGGQWQQMKEKKKQRHYLGP